MFTFTGYNINPVQGDDFTLNFTVKDSSSVPINLSGYAVSGLIRSQWSATGVLAHFDVEIVNTGQGQVRLSIPAAETAQIPVGNHLYEVEYTNTISGTSAKFLRGRAACWPELLN